MDYSSASQRLQTIKKYIADRVASSKSGQSPDEMFKHAEKLTTYFAKDGVLIDSDKHSHTGTELFRYFRSQQPEPSSISEPQLLSDGRFQLEFSVWKMFKYWPIRAYFTFQPDSNLIQKLEIERQGFF